MLGRIFYALPWLLLGLLLIVFGLALAGPSGNVPEDGVSIAMLRQDYEAAVKVNPSSLAPRLIELAQKRVECFGASPLERFKGGCRSDYLNAIMKVGREEIVSAPRLGDFLANVDNCPVMYSVCMGEKSEQNCRVTDGERVCDYADDQVLNCAAMEARCIDGVLDLYWRGSPVDTSYGADRRL